MLFKRIRVEDLLNDAHMTPKGRIEPHFLVDTVRNENVSTPFASGSSCYIPLLPSIYSPMSSGSSNTRHSCMTCNSTFSTLPNLNKHVSPYYYNLPRVPSSPHRYTYSHLSNLCFPKYSGIDHPFLNSMQIRSVHRKFKPFRCSQCHVMFGFKDGLQRHMEKLHDQSRPIACAFCSQRFKIKSHLTKHFKLLHSEIRMSAPVVRKVKHIFS